MADETRPEEQRERSQRALKTFLDSQQKVSHSTEKGAVAARNLADRIGDDKQGLIAAVADLIDAIDDLKEVVAVLTEVMAKTGGFSVDLASLLNTKRRR